jgi:hypothetical protein
MRLKLHPGSGRDVQDLIGREDSSAAQAEDAKFKTRQGFIIDPAAIAGSRGNPGDAKAVTPRAARFGVTRRFAPRQPEDAEAGATRWNHREARLEERSGGATRSSSCRQRRRMRDAGQPGAPSLAQPEGAEAGATRRKHWEARLKERGRGATRRIPLTAALKDGKPGQPEAPSPGQPERAEAGATRRKHGEARHGGARTRGDPENCRRQRRRMRDARQLEDASPAQLKSAPPGATWEMRSRRGWKTQPRGNPGMQGRHNRKTVEPGKPGTRSQGWMGRSMFR